jgi:hypothetical protein
MHYFVSKFPLPLQKVIIMETYKNLDSICLNYGKESWTFLKKLLRSIEVWDSLKIIEIVKLSLLQKISEVSLLLGKKIVENEMLPLLREKFLKISKFTSLKVKIKTIAKLRKILEIVEKKIQWRMRFLILKDFEHFLNLFDLNDVLIFIMPLFFLMCKDQCNVIRKTAAKKIYDLIIHFQIKNPDYLFIVYEKIFEFALSSQSIERLVFIDLCENLVMKNKLFFSQEIKEKILKLSKDKVINVKIRICFFCKTLFKSKIDISFAKTVLENFKDCIDIDIVNCMKEIKMVEKKDVSTLLKNNLIAAHSFVTSEIIPD